MRRQMILVSLILLVIPSYASAIAPQAITSSRDHGIDSFQSNGPISPEPTDADIRQVEGLVAQLKKVGRRGILGGDQPSSQKKQLQINDLLKELGPLGNTAVSGLNDIIQDTQLYPYVRLMAVYELGEIGSSEAVPSLVNVLNSTSSKDPLFKNTIKALGKIGESASSAIPVLLGFYDTYDMYNDLNLAINLGKIGCREPRIIDQLTFEFEREKTDLDDWEVYEGTKRNVAIALANSLGPDMDDSLRKKVSELLSSSLESQSRNTASSSASLKREITRAIGKISRSPDSGDTRARERIKEIVSSLNSPSVDQRLSAVKALGEMGGGAKGAVSELIKRVEDIDRGVRTEAMKVLEAIDPSAVTLEVMKKYLVAQMRDLSSPDDTKEFLVRYIFMNGTGKKVVNSQLAAAQILREKYSPEERLELIGELHEPATRIANYYLVHSAEPKRTDTGLNTFISETVLDVLVLLQRAEQNLTSAI